MKHKVFVGIIVSEILILMLLLGSASVSTRKPSPELAARKQLVKAFMLTDLAIWTEAHYTRNPSQADLFAPFQDFPSAIEHFPAGSMVAPPQVSKVRYQTLRKTDTLRK